MVRYLQPKLFRAPWPLFKKGNKGLRKIGPEWHEKHEWPGQNHEFPELINFNAKNFLALGPRKIDEMIGVYSTGYTDPNSGKFVEVPETIPELVVPDLTGFALKPYVSYKTDIDIEQRRKKYSEMVVKKGSEEAADQATNDWERWPPPKMDARTLFNLFYAEKIENAFKKREKENRLEKENKKKIL